MKKYATAALLITIVFSTCIPSFAQKRKPNSTPVVKNGVIQFQVIDAVSDGSGVVIRWQMTVETGNVGFFVYRVGTKGLELVNDVLIPGSATRIKDRPLYGEKYETYDPQGSSNTTYVIQCLTTDGRRISSDQISTKYTSNLAILTGKSKESYEAKDSSRNGDIETTRLTDKSISQSAEPESDLANHLWVVSQPGAKIGIKSDGLYRVTRAELQTAGFAVSSNSANWRLFLEGIEQPILVGASDQYIEFYGKGIDTVESDTRVYYLIADAVAGKRIGTRVLRNLRAGVSSNSFRVDTQKKERTSYISDILNGDADNYWGRLVFSSPTTIPVAITGIDFTARDIPLTLKMQGFTTGGPHSIRVVINGTEVGRVTGDGALPFSGQLLVPSNLLIEGSNNLELTGMASAGDYSLFDSVTLNYDKQYQADQHELRFNNPQYKKALLTGFSTSDIRLFDVSNEGAPTEVVGLPIQQNGCSYEVKIPSARGTVLFAQGATPDKQTAPATAWTPSSVPGATDGGIVTIANHGFFTGMKVRVSTTGTLPTGVSATTDYYVRKTGCNTVTLYDRYENAVTPSKLVGLVKFCTTALGCSAGSGTHTITPAPLTQAASVTPNNPSTLSTTNRNAPVVIISYSDPAFMTAANAWANYRRSSAGGSFGVEVVDVADIYDEFSYGSLSSNAIRNFLSYAKDHWQTRYVLLLGDATYDPRNYEGYGAFDLVPTKLVNTAYGESASDEALADFNNDGLADLAIGRIPARTAAVITTALGKTTSFETPAMQSFSRGTLFAYDDPLILYDFRTMSQIIAGELPASTPKTFMQADSSGQTALLNELNAGRYIINYSGHGSNGFWGVSSFFSVNTVPLLTNANNQSIFTMMSCFNGNFTGLQYDSLSESLVKASNGGGVAAWSSTGETTPDIQLYMAQQFYQELGAGTRTRIGDLIMDAKAATPAWGADVKSTWALLGDPALKVLP